MSWAVYLRAADGRALGWYGCDSRAAAEAVAAFVPWLEGVLGGRALEAWVEPAEAGGWRCPRCAAGGGGGGPCPACDHVVTLEELSALWGVDLAEAPWEEVAS